jgi:hypothetical protein
LIPSPRIPIPRRRGMIAADGAVDFICNPLSAVIVTRRFQT